MLDRTPITLSGSTADDLSILLNNPMDPRDGQGLLRNVTVPTLTPYLPEPERRTGTSVVIAPGGGLHFLSIDNEGAGVAEQLAARGISAFVLHYRTLPTPVPDAEWVATLQRLFTEPDRLAEVSRSLRDDVRADGGAAIRLVRDHAGDLGLDPARVGMLGFSAGGFATLATALDGTADERPSFLAPIYPAWWGDVPVPQPAPPMFLAWASDDALGEVIVGASMRVYDAWRKAGAPVEAHAYASGGHGFGIQEQGAPSDAWFGAFLAWLATAGF